MLVLTFYFYGQMGNSISSKKVNVSLKTLLFSSFFVAYSIEVMRACLADSTFLDLTIASRYGCRQSSRPHRCLPQRIASNESVVGRLGRNNAALYCSLKKMTRPIAVVIPRRRSRCSPFHCPFRYSQYTHEHVLQLFALLRRVMVLTSHGALHFWGDRFLIEKIEFTLVAAFTRHDWKHRNLHWRWKTPLLVNNHPRFHAPYHDNSLLCRFFFLFYWLMVMLHAWRRLHEYDPTPSMGRVAASWGRLAL